MLMVGSRVDLSVFIEVDNQPTRDVIAADVAVPFR
jgi:hypothetical protein